MAAPMAPCLPVAPPLAQLCPPRPNQQFCTPMGINPQFATMVASPLFQMAPWAVGPLPWVQQPQQVKAGLCMENVVATAVKVARSTVATGKPRGKRGP